MDLGDLLTNGGVIASLSATSKKQVLLDLAEAAAKLTGLDAKQIYEKLLRRERLGSTGLGRGIAIPHEKFAELKAIHCLFARLAEPIDFEGPDSEPVDLVFLLLAPEHASGDHLKALARISRLVREPAAIEKLRQAKDAEALKAILTLPATSHAA